MAKKQTATATTRPKAPKPVRDPDDVAVMERIHSPGSLSDIVDQVRDAITKAFASEEVYTFVRDITKKDAVYEVGGDLFRVKYSIGADGNVTLAANPETVVIQYVPAVKKESASESEGGGAASKVEIIESDMVMPLTDDAALAGVILAKIIEPGEGSSGFYSPEVLARDGPGVFSQGTHMYWNHPTESEMSERPEGDISKLAGVLDSNATYQEDGPDGPGLYATISVVKEYAQAVRELAPFTGLSIRAQAIGEPREGKSTPRLTELLHAHSVDFVTRAGAGGKIVTAFEAAGRGEYVPGAVLEISETATVTDPTKESIDMPEKGKSEKETTQPQPSAELIESNNRLTQRLIRVEAKESALALITAAGINDPVIRDKVLTGVLESVPMTDSQEVDQVKLADRVTSVLETELTYLKKIQGVGARVRDLGEARKAPETMEVSEKDLAEVFARPVFGLTEAGAKVAARI